MNQMMTNVRSSAVAVLIACVASALCALGIMSALGVIGASGLVAVEQAYAATDLSSGNSQLEDIEDGHAVFLRNVKTGKRLAVAKGSRKAGAAVKFAKAKANKAQKFRFVKKGSWYLLQNVKSCKYVGVSKGKLRQYSSKKGANKRWRPVYDQLTGKFYIESKLGGRLDGASGTSVLAVASDNAAQQFKITPTFGFKIYLDPGHGNQPGGGYDPGADGCGRTEAPLTKDLVKRIEEALDGSDVKVVNGSKYRLAYWQRISKANKLKCDVALSVHFDAGGGSTTSTMVGTSGPLSKSKAFNKIIHKALVKSLGISDGGTSHRGDITFVNGKIPSVLMEVCFIDNSSNLSKYMNRRDDVAMAIAEAIEDASRVAKLQR